MNLSTERSPSEVPEEFGSGTTVACVILAVSFLVGVPGNLLVIWTILRHMKHRSHIVVLIMHLAAADMLVLITLPLWIYSLVHTWTLGESLCRALVYIISVCMFSSIFFITLMSVERFVAVCHPFVMMRWKTRRTMNRCVAFLWLIAFLLGVPAILFQPVDEGEGTEQCFFREFNTAAQEISILCLETLVGFILPFIILSICYCLVNVKLKTVTFNSKMKSRVLVHTVVITFILCWFPYHSVNVINLVCIVMSEPEHECVPDALVFSSGALAFINSSVNPVLYVFFAQNFRGSLGESRLVKLFQEMTRHSNNLGELALQQQQTGQTTPKIQTELISDSSC